MIFIIDALFLNQGVIAMITLIVVFIFWLPLAIILIFKKQPSRIPLIKSFIYGFMAVSVLGANTLNNKLAQNRAEALIVAIEQYHQDNAKYPDKLENLVPQYIPKVPIAKYVLSFNKFWYSNHNEYPDLYYVDLPPFGRPTYNFNHKKWIYID